MTQRLKKESFAQLGFSLLELMIVVLILSVITGAVFSQISMVQQRARTEQSKLDIFQESREFMDQLGRDLHQTGRSEEHTSELQSPCNLVCRLLLEKKKR